MTKRLIVRVQWRATGEHWTVSGPGLAAAKLPTKTAAVRTARAWAKSWVAADPANNRSQVVVYKRNGRIAEERTYPRNSDPRRRKG